MRPRTDGRLLGAEQRRLAFSDALILLKTDAAKSSKDHFRSLFVAEKKTIVVSIACKRRGIRWGKNEPTPRVTTEGIKLDGGISLSPSLSLSLSLSLSSTDGRRIPKEFFLTLPNRSRSVTDSCTAGVDPPMASRP